MKDAAIEAAAKGIAALLGVAWDDAEQDEARHVGCAALAAAVPLVLDEAARRIEAEQLHDDTGDPGDQEYMAGLADALAAVRALRDEWSTPRG